MARQIEERLVGYRFGVAQIEAPDFDERGNQVFNGNGTPKTHTEFLLEFVDAQPTGVHIVRVSFTQAARDELVRMLTGGITVAHAGDVPKGIELL